MHHCRWAPPRHHLPRAPPQEQIPHTEVSTPASAPALPTCPPDHPRRQAKPPRTAREPGHPPPKQAPCHPPLHGSSGTCPPLPLTAVDDPDTQPAPPGLAQGLVRSPSTNPSPAALHARAAFPLGQSLGPPPKRPTPGLASRGAQHDNAAGHALLRPLEPEPLRTGAQGPPSHPPVRPNPDSPDHKQRAPR